MPGVFFCPTAGSVPITMWMMMVPCIRAGCSWEMRLIIWMRRRGGWKKGFVTIKNKTYYFDEEGLLTRGSWVENCYLDENGQMQKNIWIGAWYVGEDGKKTGKKRTPGFFTENNKTFYSHGSYQKRTGWIVRQREGLLF